METDDTTSYGLSWQGPAARHLPSVPVPAHPQRARWRATCSRASPSCAPIRRSTKPDVQFVFQPAKRLTNPKIPFPLGHGYAISPVALYPKSRGTLRLASADPARRAADRPEPARASRTISTAADPRAARSPARPSPARRSPSTAAPKSRPAPTVQSDAQSTPTSARPATPCTTRSAPAAWARDEATRWSIRSCGFNGIKGLRVADAAVMPSIIGGNTNAPA